MFSPSKTLRRELANILKNDLPFARGSGWRVLKKHRDFGAYVIVNRKLGLILKSPIVTIGKQVAGLTLPTVDIWNGWVLQPICTFENRGEAVKQVASRMAQKKLDRDAFDLHVWNVGWYEGTAYLFDW